MVITQGLTYQYPETTPIHFPDMEVDAGQALLVCGESGCGKTTLLHLLAGLRSPTGGEIRIGGNKTSQLSAADMDRFRGQKIGIVYQQSFFIQSLSVLDNLMLSLFQPYFYQVHMERASSYSVIVRP